MLLSKWLNEGQDRLDSTRNQGGYYPYGEAQTPGNLDQDRFATYYRDGTSLLDYARNATIRARWAGSCRRTRTAAA